MKAFIKKYYKLVLWCIVIFALSIIPSAKISDFSYLDFFVRKFLHIFEFFILTILAYNSFGSYKKAYFFAFFYAISDELHQHFTPGRGPSPIDVLVDIIGVILGIIFIWKELNVHLPKTIKKLLS